MYIRFSIFFSYVGTLLPNVCSQIQQYSVFFVCERHKGLKCFGCVGDFLLSKNMDQRICIKFCVKNGIKYSKTLEMLKVAYGECTVSQKSVYKWCKLFTVGREEPNEDARPGRPSTSTTSENTEAVKKIVMRIVESLLEKLLRMSAYRLAHAMQFFRTFWV